MVLYAKLSLGPTFVRGQSLVLNSVEVHVVNEKGNSLNVDFYDALTGKMISSSTALVGSDDYTNSFQPDLSNLDHDTLMRIVVYTTDQSGKTVSITQLNAIVVGSTQKIQFDHKVDVVHIAIDGTVISYRAYAVFLPDNDGIITLIYDPEEKTLYCYKGKNINGMFKGTSGIVEMRFRIPRKIATFYAGYIDDQDVINAVWKVPELVPIVGAIAAIRKAVQGYPVRLVGISFEYDDQYVYVTADAYISLASPWSWWALAKILAGIAMLVGAGLVAMGTLGGGTPVAVGLALTGAGLIGAGLQEMYDSDLRERYDARIVETAKSVGEQAKKRIEVTISNLKEYLNKLVEEGKLTQDEANAIMNYVENIKNEAFEAIDTLTKMVENAYKAGYNDGYKAAKEKYSKYVIASGVGGAIGGAIVGAYIRGR